MGVVIMTGGVVGYTDRRLPVPPYTITTNAMEMVDGYLDPIDEGAPCVRSKFEIFKGLSEFHRGSDLSIVTGEGNRYRCPRLVKYSLHQSS